MIYRIATRNTPRAQSAPQVILPVVGELRPVELVWGLVVQLSRDDNGIETY